MAKLIKLIDRFGRIHLVNVDYIVNVIDIKDIEHTRVYLSVNIEGSPYIMAKETPEQIIALINGQ